MENAKHAKKDAFTWVKPEEPKVISYDPPKEEWLLARINTLARENTQLRAELEKRAEWYGMGKDAFEKNYNELADENARLREENGRLKSALIREAIRDV